MDGAKFDSSVDRDEPFAFVLGTGQVIQGWDQGMVGMRLESEMSMRDETVFGTNGRPELGPSTTVYSNNRRFSSGAGMVFEPGSP